MKFALFGNVYQAKKSTAVQKLFSVISAKGGELFSKSLGVLSFLCGFEIYYIKKCWQVSAFSDFSFSL